MGKEKKTSSRGFIVTISAMLLIALLLAFVASAVAAKQGLRNAVSEELPAENLGYYSSGASSDLLALSRMDFSMERANSTLNITLSGNMNQQWNYASELSAYSAYVSGELANKTHSQISLNASGINDGTFDIIVDYPGNTILYSENYSAYSALFGPLATYANSNATQYYITISTSKPRANSSMWSWNPAGDINITVNYTDASGNQILSGTISSGKEHNATWFYSDGSSLSLLAGELDDDRVGAVSILQSGPFVPLVYRISAILTVPPSGTAVAYINATMNYSQGAASKYDYLEVSRA